MEKYNVLKRKNRMLEEALTEKSKRKYPFQRKIGIG